MLQIRIQIKTPKGHAKKTATKIKPYILGLGKQPKQFKTNTDDSKIIWTIEGTPKQIMRIQKNCIRYDVLITQLLNNKFMKKNIHKYLSEESKEELEDMLINQTEVSVLKGHQEPLS